ncbi:MAG: TolC family protein [Oligoflexus sp.]
MHRRLLAFLPILLLAISIPAAHAAGIEVKYDDLLKLIDTSHPLIQARRLQIQAQKQREGRFKQSFKPRLELSTSIESFQLGEEDLKTQPSLSAIGIVNLYNGGRDRLQDSKFAAEARKSEAIMKNLRRNRLANIRHLYWEYLYWQEFIAIHEEAIQQNQVYLKQAKQRISAGRANATDRVEFEMKTVALSQEREDARLEIKRISYEIAIELGLDGNTRLEINHPYQHEHDDSSIEKLHNETLEQELIADYTADIALKSLELETIDRNFYPKIDVFGGLSQFNQRERDGSTANDRLEKLVGLRLSLTLDSSSIRQNEIAALHLERHAIEQEMLYRQREIEQEFIADSRKMQLLHEQIHGAEANVKRAQSYLKLTLVDYQRGVKNSSDVVGAAEKKIEFRVILAKKIRDYQILKGHILSEIGR